MSQLGRTATCLLGFSITIMSSGPVDGADAPAESWDAVYIKKYPVGYIHTTVEPKKDRGRDLLRVQVEMHLNFKRGKDASRIELLYGTIENPDGQILRLDTRVLASRQEMRTYGDVVNNQMILKLEGSGSNQQKTIPWGPDVRGPYGVEQSLVRKPMQAGETREVKIFEPELNRIVVARLVAKGVEPTELGGRVTRDLLRIEQQTILDGNPQPGTHTFWSDGAGQTLKTHVDSMGGMDTYRTTREYALKSASGGQFDLKSAQIIPVRQAITNPTGTREVVYDLALTGDDLSTAFPNDRRQTSTATAAPAPGGAEPSRLRMTVRVAGPVDGEAGPEAVDAAFSRPNAMINSDDSRVVTLARRATAGITAPFAQAEAIEQWVFKNIRRKDFETTFAPASEVARDLTGDCSEHSVLTAAMCRAAGIPARCVLGLIYVENDRGFGFHMWNEVYVNRRWVAIDAAFDQSDVDATHLKLTDTSLDGVSPFEAFLAVARVFGRLAIEPVEVR